VFDAAVDMVVPVPLFLFYLSVFSSYSKCLNS